jgi:hypothetical protein
MAGEGVNSSFVILSKFDAGRQEIASKYAKKSYPQTVIGKH